MTTLPAGRWGLAAVLATGAALGAGALAMDAHGAVARAVAGEGFLAVAILAVAGCLVRMRRDGPGPRLSWALVATAMAVEIVTRAGAGAVPAGWPLVGSGLAGDLVHLVPLVLLAAALAKLPGTAQAGTGWRLVSDGVGVVCATVVIAGHPLFANVHGFGAKSDAASAHLLGGALVATAALLVLSRMRYAGAPSPLCLGPLCAGALGFVASDVAATAHVLAGGGPAMPGAATDIGWFVGAVALLGASLAGARPDERAVTSVREYVAVLGLVLPSAMALALVAIDVITGVPLGPLPMAGAFGLAGAVLARHAVARIDSLAITRTLEDRVAERTLELVTREQWFRSLVQNSSDVLTVVDAAGVVRYQSPAVTRVFGHDPALLLDKPMSYLMRSADARRLEQVMAEAIASPRSTYMLEFAVWHKDGRWCETETSITTLLDGEDIRGLVLNTRDISERRRLEDALTHQAFHDNLTGLANRVLFHERVAHALSLAPAPAEVAVLFLDLDGFKGVNDTQGHAVGDQLLGLVAERLQHCVRPADTVARLGGDEFAVLVHGRDASRASVWVAERVREAIAQPFVLDGREISIGVSTGIALNLAAHESADVLLRNADVAMYKAKARRDGGWVRFEPGMRDALLERLEVENDLKLALGRGQLVTYFQPTVELGHGSVVGAEALLRWHHPTRGIVGPEEFIALAEETGHIAQIGEWVLRETCRQGARWQVWAPPGEYFHVAVNLSARQLTAGLVGSVRAALAESGLPPGALVLEITESVLVERTDEVLAILQQLKALGVRLAIDDFGTGYSSLSYLSRFPVDILKMDKSFVQAIASTTGEQAELAKTIIHLGQSLRLATVAEGIETQAQHNALRSMGCDYGQGYLFARAIPPAGLDELLSCRLISQRTGDPDIPRQRPPVPPPGAPPLVGVRADVPRSPVA